MSMDGGLQRLLGVWFVFLMVRGGAAWFSSAAVVNKECSPVADAEMQSLSTLPKQQKNHNVLTRCQCMLIFSD